MLAAGDCLDDHGVMSIKEKLFDNTYPNLFIEICVFNVTCIRQELASGERTPIFILSAERCIKIYLCASVHIQIASVLHQIVG